MRILALSDFNWNVESKSVKMNDVLVMSNAQILNHPSLTKVKFYFDIIKKHNPNLIFFCGDITGDGSCGHGYITPLTCLFKLIESIKVQTRFICGNHDEDLYFESIKKIFVKSKYIKHLTEKVETIGNIKVIGLSFNQTYSNRIFKKIIKESNSKIDFVVCHCHHTKRLNLFDFNTDFIITGHYDLKVINPNSKTFISLDNDTPTNYVVIEYLQKKIQITYNVQEFNSHELKWFKFIKNKNEFSLKDSNYMLDRLNSSDNLTYIYNIELQNLIELLQKKKSIGKIVLQKELDKILEININRSLKVTRAFLNSYIRLE